MDQSRTDTGPGRRAGVFIAPEAASERVNEVAGWRGLGGRGEVSLCVCVLKSDIFDSGDAVARGRTISNRVVN